MLLNWGGDKLISVWPTAGLAQSTGLRRADEKGSESRTGQERGGSHETLVVTSMAVRASHRLQHSRERSLPTLDTLDICLDTLLAPKGSWSASELEFRGDYIVEAQQLCQRLEMAMALLQPQQQQQQQRNWFFIDFEDDGGIYEVEVDMVGFRVFGLSVKVVTWWWICIFIVQTRFKKNIRVAIIVSQLQTLNVVNCKNLQCRNAKGVLIWKQCVCMHLDHLWALAGLFYNCIMTGYLGHNVYKPYF